MNGYLLDTNVVSETMRRRPDPRVASFLVRSDSLWLPTIVIHELEYGVQRLPQGNRRAQLRADLLRLLTEYRDRILPLDRAGAEWAAEFRAQAQRAGRRMELGDALIAGTARANELAVVTRNVDDFGPLDVEVVNPWETLSEL